MPFENHWWGRQAPESAEMAWGARAIFKPGSCLVIDLLPDRQSFRGPLTGSQPFVNWINETALPKLRVLVKKEKLGTDSTEVIRFEDETGVIEACPNESFGYLYVGAWPKPTRAEGNPSSA